MHPPYLPTLAVCAALTLALLLSACGSDDDPGAGPVPPETFGLNAQALQHLPNDGRLDELATHLDSIEALGGIDFLRTNLDWSVIEPRPPHGGARRYEWATTDAWVLAAAERGLRWAPTVMGSPTPGWAADRRAARTCGESAPPRRTADYAALVAAVADRYGPGGAFWSANPEVEPVPVTTVEIWNEPNLFVFWCPRPAPSAWARLYLAARERVERAAPRVKTLAGGLATFQAQAIPPPKALPADAFLRSAVSSHPRLSGRIEAAAIHPYGETPAEVAATVRDFRATLERLDIDAPIIVNEVGWVTSGEAAPLAEEDERAELLPAATRAVLGAGCGVAGFAPHAWASAEADPADPEDWYGIADPVSAEPYPTATAYAGTVSELVDEGLSTKSCD